MTDDRHIPGEPPHDQGSPDEPSAEPLELVEPEPIDTAPTVIPASDLAAVGVVDPESVVEPESVVGPEGVVDSEPTVERGYIQPPLARQVEAPTNDQTVAESAPWTGVAEDDDEAGDDASGDVAHDDTARDDTARDDTARDDTAFDDMAFDDTAIDDLARDDDVSDDYQTHGESDDDALHDDAPDGGTVHAGTLDDSAEEPAEEPAEQPAAFIPPPVARSFVPVSLDVPEEAPQPKAPRERVTARSALTAGGRTVIALVAVAVAVIAIGGTTVVSLPRYTIGVPAAVVTPVASLQQRVCPGPLLSLGGGSGLGSRPSSFGPAAVSSAASAGRVRTNSLAVPDNEAKASPLVLALPPTDGASASAAPALTGSQSQNAASRDIVGFAAAECTEPSADTWLSGGATTVGRTTLITLANPTAVPATVNLSIYGEAGRVPAPGADGIVVAAGAQRILSLAAFAPDVTSPIVRVQSTGGQVSANLQESIVRTLDPGGVDIVGPSRGPSRTTIIPGFAVSGAAAVTAVQGRVGYEDLTSVLRIFLPGTDAATATVTITPERNNLAPGGAVEGSGADGSPVGEDGPAAGTTASSPSFPVSLLPGVVTDVPLNGLVDGAYTISVESQQPVIASARASALLDTSAGGGITVSSTDFAWFSSATALDRTALLSVAAGPSPRLHLANTGAEPATVTVRSSAGTRTVQVPAGASESVQVASGGVTLGGVDGLFAAISYSGGGAVAGFRVTPPAAASKPVTVYR